MRFLSSSALANAEKLRLAASCSAAEAMVVKLPLAAPPMDFDLYRDQAACSPASRAGAKIVTEPPAFSTAATADLEAPHTDSATLALISPMPSRRIPALARRTTPALTRAAASIGA